MRRHADNSYRIKVDETEYKIDVLPELGTMTCCAVIYVKRGSLWTHFCHTTDYEYHDDAKAEALRIIKCRHHVYPDDDFHRALQKMVDKWTEKWSRILSEDDGPWANVIPPPLMKR